MPTHGSGGNAETINRRLFFYLKRQYCHNHSRLSKGYGIGVLDLDELSD